MLGAGLAGLSAAWHLQEKGIECIVLEKEKEPGGLCRSKRINGFSFDYSGHLLHFKHKYTFNFIRNLLGGNLTRHKRNSWVYSHGRYIAYPFQANFHSLSSSAAKECLSGFIQASRNKHCKKNGNFLSWINQTFGEGIARNFMVPYNAKFWTVPPEELTCEWLDGFIPVLSPAQISAGAAGKNRQQFGYNAQFWYPRKGGISMLPLALASQVRHIYTDAQAVRIDLSRRQVLMKSGKSEKFDYLISTVPMPEMAHLIEGIPGRFKLLAGKLRWNSIFNLNLGIERAGVSASHWVYFPQDDLCFFRLGFFHNFSPALVPARKSSLYVEVSYSRDKPIDKNNIVFRILKDLEKTGILRRGDKISSRDINDIEYGYPIYDSSYKSAREGFLKFLEQNNVISCGRYGLWRYLSMEGAIRDGRRVAELF